MGAPLAMIPHAIPSVDDREGRYIADAMRTGDLADGIFISLFENSIRAFTGAQYAVAMSSGTAALHIALVLAGVGPGDRVIVPATTFIATANAVRYCGATPVIVDVDPATWTLDVDRTAEALRASVKAVVPVHLYGHPCRLDALRALAYRYGVSIIEDAAEALGALYKGCPVGLDGLAILSFNGNKLITTGGGGMLLTDDEEQARRARYLIGQAREDAGSLTYGYGFNYRMPNLNAAVGVAQMETIADRVKAKRATAEDYQSALAGVFKEQPWARSSYWLSAILVDDAEATRQRLAAQGITCRRVWRPLHMQPGSKGCERYGGEVAERLYARGLTLPSSVGITPEERERVICALSG